MGFVYQYVTINHHAIVFVLPEEFHTQRNGYILNYVQLNTFPTFCSSSSVNGFNYLIRSESVSMLFQALL